MLEIQIQPFAIYQIERPFQIVATGCLYLIDSEVFTPLDGAACLEAYVGVPLVGPLVVSLLLADGYIFILLAHDFGFRPGLCPNNRLVL